MTGTVRWRPLVTRLIVGLFVYLQAAAARADDEPITDEEVERWGRTYVESIASGRSAPAAAMLDDEAMLDEALEGLDATPNVVHGALTGRPLSSLPDLLAPVMKQGASMAYLRVTEHEETPAAMIRLLTPHGINYHVYLLGRSETGDVVAVDLYPFTSGELLSQTTRKNMLPLVIRFNPELRDKLTERQREAVDSLPLQEKLINAFTGQDYLAVMETYPKLPESVQLNRSILMMYANATMQTNIAEYNRALERIEKQFGDDPMWLIMQIDVHILRGEPDKAIDSIDALEKAVGGDPMLEMLRIGVHVQMNDLEAAAKAGRRGLKADPTLEPVYASLTSVYVMQEDYEAAVDTLRAWAEHSQPAIREAPPSVLTPGLRRSEPYKKWQAEIGNAM